MHTKYCSELKYSRRTADGVIVEQRKKYLELTDHDQKLAVCFFTQTILNRLGLTPFIPFLHVKFYKLRL